MVISPLNYPGNKAKIVKQIISHFPEKTDKICDVFAGSGTVSVNSTAHFVYFNDASNEAVELFKYFLYNKVDKILFDMEEIINSYNLTNSRIMPKGTYIEYKHEGLSNYNKSGYFQLRDDYNKDKSVAKLFALIVYGFNHYIRFNSKGEFNVPVGKVDFSKSLYDKTIQFSTHIKTKDYSFSSYDFRNKKLYESDADLYYFDPPYLITNAPYNVSWTAKEETDLLNLLDELNEQKIRFALSNVILSKGVKNDLLVEWSKKYKVIPIKRQYKNANYRKKDTSNAFEVLIINY